MWIKKFVVDRPHHEDATAWHTHRRRTNEWMHEYIALAARAVI